MIPNPEEHGHQGAESGDNKVSRAGAAVSDPDRASLVALQSTLDALPDHIAVIDVFGTILASNAAWNSFPRTSLICTPRGGVGTNYFEACRAAATAGSIEVDKILGALREVTAGDKNLVTLDYAEIGDQQERWFTLRAASFNDGAAPRVVITHIDITSRVAADKARRETQAVLRNFYETAPMIMGIVELRGEEIVHISDNKATARFFGDLATAPSDDSSRAPQMPPRNNPQWYKGFRQSEKFEMPIRFEYRVGPPEQPQWYAVTVCQIAGGRAPFSHFSYIADDITESMRAEESLRDSEERFRQMTESMSEVFYLRSVQSGEMLYVNRAYERIWGRSCQSLYGDSASWDASIHPEDRAAVAAASERQLQQSLDSMEQEFRIVRPDESIRWISANTSLVRDRSETVTRIAGTATDVTERKLAVEARIQLAAIVESSVDAILSWDLQGMIRSWNMGAERLYGYPAAKVIGQRVSLLMPPEQVHELGHILHRIRQGETIHGLETRRLCRDGRIIDVSLTVSPVRDATGKVIAASTIARDITEKKANEAVLKDARHTLEIRVRERTEELHRELQERLLAQQAADEARREAERANREKSEFLSRMSHELRTPLNAILGFGQLLEFDTLDEDQQESVSHILKGGRHLLVLINELLDIARIEAGHMRLSLEPVLLAEVLDEACSMVGPLADQRNVSLHQDYRAWEEEHVLADRQRLKQVVINLLNNALKYNRPNGRVDIRAEPFGSSQLRIAIIDTGVGIPPERMNELFSPFQRLGAERGEIEGTGLGLALSKRLIEAMGGTISVASEPGTGSTFSIQLPLADCPISAACQELAEEDEQSPLPEPGRTLLYIEDNLSNLRLIEKILANTPEIRLLSATHGHRGLEIARQRLPDLILLDLDLPDVDGHDVLRALKEDPRTKHIPVVAVSADATLKQVERLLAEGAVEYLTKPLGVKKLLRVIVDILEQEPCSKIS